MLRVIAARTVAPNLARMVSLSSGHEQSSAEGRRRSRRSELHAETAFPDLDFEHIAPGSDGNAARIDAPDATFELRSTGLGTLLHIAVAPGATVCAAPGRLLGHSPAARTALAMTTAEHGAVAAASRVLSGAPLVLTTVSAPIDASVDALVAPSRLSEIALLELDGAARYCIVPGALLATTEGVRLGPWTGLKRGRRLRLAHATGRGLVAVAGYGGLASLKLAKGESYVVRASNLVAWDDRVVVGHHKSRSLAQDADDAAGSDSLARGWRFASLASSLGSAIKSLFASSASLPFVHVQGPGELILNTRSPPAFSRWFNSRRSNDEHVRPSPPPASASASASAPASASSSSASPSSSPDVADANADAADSTTASTPPPADDAPKSRFGGVFKKPTDDASK